MKIVLISDNHDQNLKTKWSIPDGDVLCHVGDLVAVGDTIERFRRGARNLGRLPHPVKLYVPGNHDKLAYREPEAVRAVMAERGIRLLFDEAVELDGKTFYGSPWLPYRGGQFHGEYPGDIMHVWRRVPNYCDVLLTHVPPAGILDWSPKMGGQHIGCSALVSEILYRIQPAIHAFGHNHSRHGEALIHGTRFINASLCDDAYRPAFAPIVVEL